MTGSAARRCLSTITVLIMIAACGGGGGGGSGTVNPSPAPTPAPPPTETAPNSPPNANFTMSAFNGNAPLVITVDATASTDSDGDIVTYDWDFDGAAGIGAIAQHTFEQAGTFTIELTVTDDAGDKDSFSQLVTVTTAPVAFSVSGTVHILSSTAVDSDVNDRLTAVISNNSFDAAQELPSPVTLGGFANIAGSGADTGNLFDAGDPADFYRISLSGGEVIVLSIAEAEADLDLRLWNENRQLIDAAMSVNNSTETINVTNAGTYFIEVFPVLGATNYTMHVGQDLSVTRQSRETWRLSDPFIPGELIIKPHAPISASGTGLSAIFPELSTTPQSASENEDSHGRPRAPLTAGLYTLRREHPAMIKASALPPGSSATPAQQIRLGTLNRLKQLQQDPNIIYAERNMLVTAHAVPNDTFYGSQWHYTAINLPPAWDTTTGDNDVIVAVVDTGVLLTHPDLQDRLVAGYDFISDAERALDGDGLDADPSDPGDRQYGDSSSFHGTHVAGTVGAQSNNGRGVSGVTWQTLLMPLRALGKDGGTTYDIVQAVRYASGLPNASMNLPPRSADIINLSLGTSFSSQSEQEAYLNAAAAGVLVIASAGNDSSDIPSYPAAYDGVIAVSASTISNELANYSNFGGYIDLSAPGGSTLTDLNGDGIGDGVISTSGDDSGPGIEFVYAALAGTSMAAPHVAGVAALMKAAHPALTPTEFDLALLTGELTDDLGNPGRDDQFGYGLINAHQAVLAAQRMASGEIPDPGPILTASATTLNFGAFLSRLEVRVQNSGTGEPQVQAVTTDQDWVSITGPQSPDGLGTYTVQIDRSDLSDGAYEALVTFESDANDISVTLIMQVSQANLSADAGLFYVVLIDEEGDTARQTVAVADQGEYPFTINNVPSGQYRLFAGGDADDDAKLCDGGEACGAYPTLDSPDPIPVNGHLDDLDFEAGFRMNLTNSTGFGASAGDKPITAGESEHAIHKAGLEP